VTTKERCPIRLDNTKASNVLYCSRLLEEPHNMGTHTFSYCASCDLLPGAIPFQQYDYTSQVPLTLLGIGLISPISRNTQVRNNFKRARGNRSALLWVCWITQGAPDGTPFQHRAPEFVKQNRSTQTWHVTWPHIHRKTSSVDFGPQDNCTDWRPPLDGECSMNNFADRSDS
jgi:hypothetical protein